MMWYVCDSILIELNAESSVDLLSSPSSLIQSSCVNPNIAQAVTVITRNHAQRHFV